MADELVYREFSIRAEPYQLQVGGWTLEGVLVENGKGRTCELRFYLGGTTDTRDAAVAIILDEGKRLIDFQAEKQEREA